MSPVAELEPVVQEVVRYVQRQRSSAESEDCERFAGMLNGVFPELHRLLDDLLAGDIRDAQAFEALEPLFINWLDGAKAVREKAPSSDPHAEYLVALNANISQAEEVLWHYRAGREGERRLAEKRLDDQA